MTLLPQPLISAPSVLLVFLFTLPLRAAFAGAGKVPAVIVFGDSSVDSGNNNQIATLLKSNFEPYGRDFIGQRPTGRFSNGRVPPDLISEAIGLRPFVPAYLDPAYKISDFAGGVCFASAGTGYDNVTSDVLNVIPLWKEVEYYKDYQKKLRAFAGDRRANRIIREALYLVSMGTNDFLENYYLLPGKRAKQFTADEFGAFLVGIAEEFVREIYALGARKISLGGLPPMGCLPLERTVSFLGGYAAGVCNDQYNAVAVRFNRRLNLLIKKLNAELPGIRVAYSDVYTILSQIITKPSAYGFEEASVACCGTGLIEMSYLCDGMNPLTCTDADKYVFWDSFHLTERTNRVVVDYLMKTTLRHFFAL
ncbi:unnamed protein product [Cuscuta campestris]|uniref:SGNH hydrolase-type esterase domain-containing protein n=1 Tax=Cuscuta campestris TaxID=132261 RepID=A0A484K9J1_9ASTE|nr:unnamed protein product [Cuscuta campestris]